MEGDVDPSFFKDMVGGCVFWQPAACMNFWGDDFGYWQTVFFMWGTENKGCIEVQSRLECTIRNMGLCMLQADGLYGNIK
jgi:hypothetical protein